MKKIIIFVVGFLLATSTFAQDNNDRAEKLFGYIVSGMGDSIYSSLNDKAQAALPVTMLNGLMQQLEPMYGKYCNHGKWQSKETMGITVYFCDAHFDKGNLRFLTAFDSDGKANTLRFIPVETKAAVAEPLPNNIEEKPVIVESGAYKLPGIWTMPKGQGKYPVVVLVHGSGPNDKDENIGPNHPFKDLAWGLAQQGVAVLRYDKRTKVYGQKWLAAGEEANVDHETVDDAVSAVDLAMKQPSADTKRVYVLGHSLGAMMAPRIAQRIKGLGGIIMMAAPARPLEDAIVEQVTYLNSLGTPSADDIAQIDSIKLQANNVKHIGTPQFNQSIGLPLDLPFSYWKGLNSYNQLETASKLSIPIFIVQGMRDYQVTMTDFALWKRKLRSSRRIQFKAYTKLNHLFMEGSGMSLPAEYMAAKPVPDYVINDIVKFINHETIGQ